VVLTSFHQSALPTALALRLAGVRRITAISEDYPGSLLDVRVGDPGDVPEARRALDVASAAGFALPAGDGGGLAVRRPLPETNGLTGPGRYVVLHPGTSVPARAWPEDRWADTVRRLDRDGVRVVVTGRTGGGVPDRSGGRWRGLRPRWPDDAARTGRRAVPGRGRRRRQHRTGSPGRGRRDARGVAVRADRAGRALGAVRRAAGASRRSAGAVPSHPGHPVPGHPCLAGVTAGDVVAALGRLGTVAA
jgi:hypothetical protein